MATDPRGREYRNTVGPGGLKIGRPRISHEGHMQNALDRGGPPSLRERVKWAQDALERMIDLLEKNPKDHIVALAVVRCKKELVDLKDRLPRRDCGGES